MRISKRAVLATALALAALVAAGAWVVWERCGVRGCPDIRRLEGFVHDEAPVVVDRRGVELTRLYRVDRVMVPLDSLPAYVPAAFVAIEDQRFWEHGGIDWRRVAGAALMNLRSGRIREGFSTITMQLARNAFPDHLPYKERTLTRKIAEMRVARRIEARYTKRQILELYINQIYFGSGAWGIDAAAREYFNKPATALNLAEAALLAGMPASPFLANPRLHPRLAVGRRWVVLQLMAASGAITPAAAAAAASLPIPTSEGVLEAARRAPYFVQEVRHLLEQELGEALYTGGYTIHTTVDPEVQAVAEAELRAQLAAVEAGRFGPYAHPVHGAEEPTRRAGGRPGTDYLQGAIVVLEAGTGDILALQGGRDFEDSRYNRATLARRQPASTFKPFLYAAALAMGRTPAHRLSDRPLRRDLGGGRIWAPQNYQGRYADSITLRDALVVSSNVASIRLAEEIGLERVVIMARNLGLRGPLPPVPAVALGTAEVTLLELTAAYAAFATLGRRAEPRLVTRVEDRQGRVVWRRLPQPRQVLDPAVAFLITDILRDVVNRGTGHGVRAAGFRGPAAGKTGTSNRGTDLWFLGYTPSRVAGIWIGLDMPRPIAPHATADEVAAPLWGRIMRRTLPRPERPWPPPPGIEMRRVDGAGRFHAPGCEVAGTLRTEYFLAGTAPRVACGRGGALPEPPPEPRLVPQPFRVPAGGPDTAR